jgi:acyl-CoA thioester hydrolase
MRDASRSIQKQEPTMSLTHTRTFRVRHYECDARGRVYHANYVRYMQETAFDASAAAGYDMARYRAMGCFWLVRETELEVIRPLFYDQSVQVKTWIADFRRVRSRRSYELSLAASGEPVARGHTDWAFLDSATGHPAPIPEDMVAAFISEGGAIPALPRKRFPPPPPPPPGTFHTRRRVEWRDLDPAGHVNNAVYLTYVEDCALQAAAAQGWPPGRLEAAGLVLQTRHYCIEYRQPALLDNELEVSTWLFDVEPAAAVRHFALHRVSDGELLSQVRTVWGTVDLASGGAVPIPDAFLAALAPSMATVVES